MDKKLFDRFLAGIAVVNVKTHDEYDQFMRMLEKETNLKWRLGQKPTQLDMFTSHREKTCIDRVVGRYIIRYSDISYYDSKGYEIIEFSDLTELEPVKAETNGEHFRKELREIKIKGFSVAVVNGKPINCGWYINCKDCLFYCKNGWCKQAKEFKKWCAEPYEAQEDKPILDKAEHDYLAAVIAPKRIYKYVDYIVKRQVNEFYVIDVHIKHTTYSTKIMLPYFKKSESMYEGMKVERQYTLKELGLEKE